MGWRYTWTYYFNEYLYSYTYMIARGVLIPGVFILQVTCPLTNPI